MTNSASQTFKVSEVRGEPCGECGRSGRIRLPIDGQFGKTVYRSNRDGEEATITFTPYTDPAWAAK